MNLNQNTDREKIFLRKLILETIKFIRLWIVPTRMQEEEEEEEEEEEAKLQFYITILLETVFTNEGTCSVDNNSTVC